MSGTRMRRMFEGRCVATMVLMRPKREASRDASKDVRPKENDAECSGVDTETQIEPIRGEALDHEAPRKGVESEQARELNHYMA